MAKLIISSVLYNFERSKERMLGHTGIYFQLVLHYPHFCGIIRVPYLYEGIGES